MLKPFAKTAILFTLITWSARAFLRQLLIYKSAASSLFGAAWLFPSAVVQWF